MNEVLFSLLVFMDDLDTSLGFFDCVNNLSENIKSKTELFVIVPLAEDYSINQKFATICEDLEVVRTELLFQNASIGETYNIALKKARGKYVSFALSSIRYVADSFERSYDYIIQNEPALISFTPWTINDKGEEVQYLMSPIVDGDICEINLNNSPERLQLFLSAYLIKRESIVNKQFNEEIGSEASIEFVCNLLADNMEYVYLPNSKIVYSKPLEDNPSAFLGQYQPEWYIDSFVKWIIPFAERSKRMNNSIPTATMIMLLYLVYVRYNCNIDNRSKGVVSFNESRLKELTGTVLGYIDGRVIYRKKSLQNISIPRQLKILFLKIRAEISQSICEPLLCDGRILMWTHKSGNEYVGNEIEHSLVTKENGDLPVLDHFIDDQSLVPVCELKKEHIIVNILNYSKGKLTIEGSLSIGHFISRDKVQLFCKLSSEKTVQANFLDIYDLKKVFGFTYARDIRFSVDISLEHIRRREEITFEIIINGNSIPIEIRANGSYAKLSDKLPDKYWKINRNTALTLNVPGSLVVTKCSGSELKQLESKFQEKLIDIGSVDSLRAVEIRKKYFATVKAYKRKHIWITFDKLYKAGDNGEYISRYITDLNNDIDIYYVIKEDSVDYDRLCSSKIKTLVWGSDETILQALLAEAVLDTHANAFSYLGINGELKLYLSDLFNAKVICIQHGLTVQNIAQFQNRWFDNTSLYLCASKCEVDNLNQKIYGYSEPKDIRLTGLARYDGLVRNDKRVILISPTWRRNIAYINVAHEKKGHNEYFKDSQYYKIYNRLINDTALIETAKKCGYSIKYLLHPAASSQCSDFNENGYVDIIPASGNMNYEQILTESSLLVTDYSGIQFDFAYMKKPLLYYHPDELPPHYDESKTYVYSRDAFGPIIKSHEELVSALCEYMEADCRMNPMYEKRVDDFFEYNDFNNCKRIYKCVRKYMKHCK